MKSVVVDVLVGWIKIWDKSMAWLRALFHIVVYRNEQGQMQCIVPAYNNHNFLGLINDLIRINKYELYFLQLLALEIDFSCLHKCLYFPPKYKLAVLLSPSRKSTYTCPNKTGWTKNTDTTYALN